MSQGAADRPCFVLASGSPRRRQLLEEAGYKFKVIVPPLPEPAGDSAYSSAAQQVEALAYFKARCVHESFRPGVPVLGADTVVAAGGAVIGKPRDSAHAREILSTLMGTAHQVITGVALIDPTGIRILASETTDVRMRPMSPTELDEYIAAGQWRGKAGAYGIQDRNDAFVECLEGSFSNVVGLPMERLNGLFAQLLLRHCP